MKDTAEGAKKVQAPRSCGARSDRKVKRTTPPRRRFEATGSGPGEYRAVTTPGVAVEWWLYCTDVEQHAGDHSAIAGDGVYTWREISSEGLHTSS